MTVLHAHGSLALGAHALHHAILLSGVVGVVALLSPRFLSTVPGPRDEHERRVLALRASLAVPPGPAPDHLSAPFHDPARVATQETAWSARPALTAAERVWLPLAAVSSTAAAGVHAAMTPAHAAEGAAYALFFAGTALAQLGWVVALANRTTRRLLHLALAGNLAVLALWALTRTLGLPFGLLPAPEAVGAWDLACAVWELVVVAGCTAALRGPDALPARTAGWRLWHPVLPTYAAGSVLLLLALSLTGTGAA